MPMKQAAPVLNTGWYHAGRTNVASPSEARNAPQASAAIRNPIRTGSSWSTSSPMTGAIET